jgi:hypothetical protein
MKKTILLTLAVAMLVSLPLGSVFAYESIIGHTGVLQYNPDKSLNGYCLFAPAGWKQSYLIDMEGYIINDWECTSGPGLHDRLLPNGNLLRGYTPEGWGRRLDPDNGITNAFPVTIGGVAGGVEEFDWDGNPVWQYPAVTDIYIQHHSFYRMPNGNTLILLWEGISYEDSLALGRDPALLTQQYGLWPDAVIEVTPEKNIVWEWHAFDHLVQNRDPALANYGEPIDNKNKFDMNFYVWTRFGYHDWSHCNTIEYNQYTDQILVNFRNWGEFYIFDHSTPNSDGGILFRWGNPGAYGNGDLPEWPQDGDQKLFGSHCATWTGAGNDTDYGEPGHVLVLDNGWLRPSGNYTCSVEVQVDYENWQNMSAAEINALELWRWRPTDEDSFYSTYQCGTQRLPNGNTHINSTDGGHIIEVTPDKEVVWEFIIPTYDADGNANCYYNDRVGATVHRSHIYPPDHPAFVGKDMTRKGHIAPNCVQMWSQWDDPSGGSTPSDEMSYSGWGFAGTALGEGSGGGGGGGSDGGY